jgi:putative transposase
LRLENERLRRIVTDLLLEKMKIEEKLAVRSSGGNGLPRRGEVQS